MPGGQNGVSHRLEAVVVSNRVEPVEHIQPDELRGSVLDGLFEVSERFVRPIQGQAELGESRRGHVRPTTSHVELVETVRSYDHWLYATLLIGAIAYIYDGYFIGLTEGAILRNAMAVSTLTCFAPTAAVAVARGSNDLLWLAMVVFMVARVATLGTKIRVAGSRFTAEKSE